MRQGCYLKVASRLLITAASASAGAVTTAAGVPFPRRIPKHCSGDVFRSSDVTRSNLDWNPFILRWSFLFKAEAVAFKCCVLYQQRSFASASSRLLPEVKFLPSSYLASLHQQLTAGPRVGIGFRDMGAEVLVSRLKFSVAAAARFCNVYRAPPS